MGNIMLFEPESLSREAFEPVTIDRVTGFFAD